MFPWLKSQARGQRGFSLIEAMVAIVVFSIGVLGLIAMQARAAQLSADARYRAEAAYLADQLVGTLSSLNPTTAASFGYNQDNFANTCGGAGGGAASTAEVTSWLNQVAAALPGADTGMQRVNVRELVPGSTVQLSVVVCWQAPGDTGPHTHVLSTQLLWD